MELETGRGFSKSATALSIEHPGNPWADFLRRVLVDATPVAVVDAEFPPDRAAAPRKRAALREGQEGLPVD